MSNIIYLLTNPIMPDLVKIGRTQDLKQRIRDLSSATGVPISFVCHYACEVNDSKLAERKIHDAFGDHRINPKREFFRINPERIVSILKLIEQKDVTPQEDVVEDELESKALARETNRRPVFRFSMLDITPGSILTYIRDENITAKVVDDRKIEFEGQTTSLSKSAMILLNRRGKTWGSINGLEFWTYEDKTLSELRYKKETETEEEE